MRIHGANVCIKCECANIVGSLAQSQGTWELAALAGVRLRTIEMGGQNQWSLRSLRVVVAGKKQEIYHKVKLSETPRRLIMNAADMVNLSSC